MLFYEVGRLYEHAARTAGRIEYFAPVRLYHFDHETHDGTRCKKFAALLSFALGELSEEIFVDLTEEVACGVRRYIGEIFQELVRQVFGLVSAGKFGVLILRENPSSSDLYSSIAFMASLSALAISFSSGKFSR